MTEFTSFLLQELAGGAIPAFLWLLFSSPAVPTLPAAVFSAAAAALVAAVADSPA